jgi:hypothetical protein
MSIPKNPKSYETEGTGLSYTELLCVTGNATTFEGAGVTTPRPIGSHNPSKAASHRHSQNRITKARTNNRSKQYSRQKVVLYKTY